MIWYPKYDAAPATATLSKSGQPKRKHNTTSAFEIAEQFTGELS